MFTPAGFNPHWTLIYWTATAHGFTNMSWRRYFRHLAFQVDSFWENKVVLNSVSAKTASRLHPQTPALVIASYTLNALSFKWSWTASICQEHKCKIANKRVWEANEGFLTVNSLSVKNGVETEGMLSPLGLQGRCCPPVSCSAASALHNNHTPLQREKNQEEMWLRIHFCKQSGIDFKKGSGLSSTPEISRHWQSVIFLTSLASFKHITFLEMGDEPFLIYNVTDQDNIWNIFSSS